MRVDTAVARPMGAEAKRRWWEVRHMVLKYALTWPSPTRIRRGPMFATRVAQTSADELMGELDDIPRGSVSERFQPGRSVSFRNTYLEWRQ